MSEETEPPLSYLAQFTLEHGEYVDYNRGANGTPLTLGSAEDVLSDALGFCGCGAPDTALRYVRNILHAISQRCPDPHTHEEWLAWYRTVSRPAIEALFNNDPGAEYLAYYLLDDKKLTEHGGSVPGWLTDKGKGILADLDEMFAKPAPP